MRKSYSPTFKAQVVRELLKEELTVGQIAAKYDVPGLQELSATRFRELANDKELWNDDYLPTAICRIYESTNL